MLLFMEYYTLTETVLAYDEVLKYVYLTHGNQGVLCLGNEKGSWKLFLTHPNDSLFHPLSWQPPALEASLIKN